MAICIPATGGVGPVCPDMMICEAPPMGEPYRMSEGLTCTGFVVVEPSEIPPNPLYLSNEDGLLISGAIISVWCIAWSIRAARMALKEHSNE